jgi:chemotaxis signal transduction protein
MLNPVVQPAIQPTPVPAPECKAIAFSICGYCLSLPISAIVRVLPVTASALFSTRNGGFTQIDGYATVLLDLHPLFAQLRYSKNSQAQFLAIARLDAHTLCAIPIDEPPTLIDIPLNNVEPLPHTYRQSLELVVSHIVNIAYNTESTTVFLLDLRGAIQALSE